MYLAPTDTLTLYTLSKNIDSHESRPASYEATFRGFLGSKLGLSAKKAMLPKPLRLHAIEGSGTDIVQFMYTSIYTCVYVCVCVCNSSI